MTAKELVTHLVGLGVQILVENGQLRIRAPKGVLTTELTDQLTRHKPELLKLLAAPQASESIPVVARDAPLPVSAAQERFLFLAQMYPDGVAYNLPNLHRLDGALDMDRFEQAIARVVMRHEALRTVFSQTSGGAVQSIAEQPGHQFELIDLSGEVDPAASATRLVTAQANQPFDLYTGPLLRVMIYRLAPEHHLFCWTLHHVISDGWSSMIFMRELQALYQGQSLEPVALHFADFGAWEREQIEQGSFDDQIAYWREQFPEPNSILSLPTDRSRPPVLSYRGASLDFVLPVALTNELKALARAQGVTLFTVLLTAYTVLLHRYSGQTDICIGSPIARRNRPEIESVYGCFINALALRSDLTGDPGFNDLLAQVRTTCLNGFSNQDVPFERIVETVNPERNTGVTPLFQAMFIFHVQDTRKVDRLGEVIVTPQDSHANASKFDLTLEVTETDHGARSFIEYSTDLFDSSTIERLAQHFQNLLASLVATPTARLSGLSLLSQTESHELLLGRNETRADYPVDATVATLFSQQVARSPDAVAVQGPDNSQVSYLDLEHQSNRLARYLIANGVGPSTLVGIYLERGIDMMCALLAVAKAGAAYVPLDPMFPPERIAYMAEDSGLSLVLTQQSLLGSAPGQGRLALALDTLGDTLAGLSAEPVTSTNDADLAYVIYTSGSTGKPKGVQVGHRALTNFLCSMVREPGLTESDCLLAVTTLSFDIAALELYLPLIVGARVVLASREESMDPARLAARLRSSEATVMQATPATWRMLLEHGWAGSRQLKILCGGEALTRELAAALLGKSGELWNMYGPTETTIWSTVHRVLSAGQGVPIGRPIANTQVYVLDSALNPVPVGVAGELFIAGDGVAQGYLNRSDLTTERFVPDPFAAGKGQRMYRTGDRARWRADGELEVQGRLDDQVKLRGYRIEPGEIRAELVADAQISDAAVIIREDSVRAAQLVAYYVPADGVSPDLVQLREALKRKLPEYMIPSDWVALDALPLTPNGKVDRKALPAPHAATMGAQGARVAPRSESEAQIAGVWARLLGVDNVGVTDGFFDLGGHSLLAVRLVSEMESELARKVPLLSLFQGVTIAELAAQDQDSEPSEASACIAIRVQGRLAPVFMIGSNPHYRQAAARLNSERPIYRLDVYALQTLKLDSSWRPHRTIEAIATQMLEEVRQIQPVGPYYIAGGCEGSLVALEMALQLQRQGELVSHLIVWITPAPGRYLKAVFNRSTARRLWYQFQALRSKGSVREIGLRGQWELLRHQIVEYSLFSAMFKYRPQARFNGAIDVARVHFDNDSLIDDFALGWGAMATNGANAVQMPGDHESWLKDHAEVFGDFLETSLSRETVGGTTEPRLRVLAA